MLFAQPVCAKPKNAVGRLLLKHNANARVELAPGLTVVDLANSYFVVQDLEKATGKDTERAKEEQEAEEEAARVKAAEVAKNHETQSKRAERVAAVKGAFNPPIAAVKEVFKLPVEAVKEAFNPNGEGGINLQRLVQPRDFGLGTKS